MSYSLDANVLLCASDRTSDRHSKARQFLEACVKGPELIFPTWPTLMSYLRIATHPRIFSTPLSPQKVPDNVSALLALPDVRPVSELDSHDRAFRKFPSLDLRDPLA